MNIEDFSQGHIDSAAHLLVDVHRAGSVGLTSVAASLDNATRLISDARQGGLGLAALEGNRVFGFLIARVPNSPGTGGLRIPDIHHAADRDRARSVYRALYEAIAGRLVRLGLFSHRVLVLAEPTVPVTTFFEMGFGVDQIKGVRPIGAEPPSATECLVEPASEDDLDDLVSLWIELVKFHSRPPILDPALPSVSGIRAEARDEILDQSRLMLVAHESGRAVGMIEAHPDSRYTSTVTIGLNVVTETARSRGVGTAMLEALLRRASAAGYEYCAVSWASANLVSDAFYRSRGFRPLRYEIVRNLDQRIAWADENLDHDAFSFS
jgi:predicted GNAT superfamily acetyltransferase